MANKKDANQEGLPFPVQVGVALGIGGGLVTGASFWIIQYWPLPVSVIPVYTFREGFVWGAVVGFFFGVILGFLCDEKHFEPQSQ
jgi:hypothetical protein